MAKSPNPIDLNLLQTLALATTLYFVGQAIVSRSAFLRRYSIPVPVVGGVLFALILAAVGLTAKLHFTMDESLKDPLLLAFFATLGLGADVRSLTRGGRKLFVLLALFVAVMIMQNAVGLIMARALDLHPLVGLLAGSISLIGGHGTAAAYASSFSSTQNLQGAMELGMAAATAGLILGRHAGPVAERMAKRAQSHMAAAGNSADTSGVTVQGRASAAGKPCSPADHIGTTPFVLLVCVACTGRLRRMSSPGSGICWPEAPLIGMVAQRCHVLQVGADQRRCSAGGGQRIAVAVRSWLMSMRILTWLRWPGQCR
jgi:ESS family glutamate:Na+ symporter